MHAKVTYVRINKRRLEKNANTCEFHFLDDCKPLTLKNDRRRRNYIHRQIDEITLSLRSGLANRLSICTDGSVLQGDQGPMLWFLKYFRWKIQRKIAVFDSKQS
jgi:hypothetical protein